MTRRLTPLAWFAIAVLILLAVSFLLITSCGPSAPEVKPTVAAPLPPESIGATVRDVAEAMRRWDAFRLDPGHPPNCNDFVTTKCVTVAERDGVMDAFRRYIAARPAKKLSSADPTQAPDAMIVASRDLVVAIADCIERKR